jgi:hypothetical protein
LPWSEVERGLRTEAGARVLHDRHGHGTVQSSDLAITSEGAARAVHTHARGVRTRARRGAAEINRLMHERPAFVPGWWTLGIDCAVAQASRPSFS